MFYGDNTEVFHPLMGFKIVNVELTHTKEEKEPAVILKCVNEHNVAIDILFQEDGTFVTEPYAVNEDLSPYLDKTEEVTHTSNIDGKTITECVTERKNLSL